MLSKYDRKYLTFEERQTLRRLTEKFNICRARETAALFHRDAEEIRARHGYSGGRRGNKYIPVKTGAVIVVMI